MITQDQRKELDAWLRPQSPLVTFARSLRMEEKQGGGQDDPSGKQQDDAQKMVDHFEGIDLDELPENIRTAVTNAKATLTKLSGDVQTAETRRGKAEEFARKKQSEVDRALGKLRQHNLNPDDPAAPNLSPNKTAHDALLKKFTDDGLKPEQAEAYAKMFASANAIQREQLLAELGPLAGAVGNLQAQQSLAAVEAANANIFAVPEIAKQVRDNVAVMVQQGNVVNVQSVNHLVEMAYGKFAMNNPDKIKDMQQIPNLGGGGGFKGGGGHVNKVDAAQGDKPVATQAETPGIIAAINAQMTHGLPSAANAKGKK